MTLILPIYQLKSNFPYLRPGGDYDFPDYPSPLHVQWHFARCKLKHPSYSGSGQSSRSGSSSSNSIEVLDPIDILSRSSSSSVEELPARPGDFQDTYIRHPQEPDFLQNPPTGNEIIYVDGDESPEIIEIFIEDQEPSTSTGRRSGQGPPTGRPQACLKRQSEVQEPGSSQKKPKTKNIGKSMFSLKILTTNTKCICKNKRFEINSFFLF